MIVLTLPLPANRGNQRAHWRVVLKQKKAYWEALNVLLWTGKLPKPPKKPWERATISAHLYTWNTMDQDALMIRCKLAVDWLKGLYIVDDSPKHLTWEGVPLQSINRKNPRLELTITPL